MVTTTDFAPGAALGRAVVDFSLAGTFPDEEVSTLPLSPSALPGAIRALTDTKTTLEAEIHTINAETAGEVNAWFSTASSIQADTTRAKALANDITKLAAAPDISGQTTRALEEKADFLVRELDYNYRVQQALKGIRGVGLLLDEVEERAGERQILEALRLLEKAWAAIDAVSVSKSCRAMRLLDIRAFELKGRVHEVFSHVWSRLVQLDQDAGRFSVLHGATEESMSLEDAVVGLKAYKEVDQRMLQLWHTLDTAIVGPRLDIRGASLPRIIVDETSISLDGSTDSSIASLLSDLDLIITFLATKLPSDLSRSLSIIMIPSLTSRIINNWLAPAVPSSLKDMTAFEDIIASTKAFCTRLTTLHYTGFDELVEWVESAPKVWLSKCRETALDTVRVKLAQGLGQPKEVERVETQMVSRDEGNELSANGPAVGVGNDEWDAAWSDEEEAKPAPEPEKEANGTGAAGDAEGDGADAWGAWGDEDGEADAEVKGVKEEQEPKPEANDNADDDDMGDAWDAWGDDDPKQDEEPEAKLQAPKLVSKAASRQATREMTLKEIYHISSLPQPMLALIFAILEDGAALTSTEHESSPVSSAAAGLFSLPTLALAMFRAIAPHCYAPDAGGNMYLYNDSAYIAERLADFAAAWKTREDLSPRARNMLRLDNDVKTLRSFANRSYGNEMSIQKTIVRDHLGGIQNILQQETSTDYIDAATARVHTIAGIWASILPRSAWYQAVGSLVDAVAVKLVADVLDMPSIGQDEAYNIANLIARTTGALDELFLPEGAKGDEAVPATAQYAPTWLRLKYLSEVLQSNLREVRYLWMESELSLYFEVEEVVDLIGVSFEDNAKVREVVREIRQNSRPVGVE